MEKAGKPMDMPIPRRKPRRQETRKISGTSTSGQERKTAEDRAPEEY